MSSAFASFRICQLNGRENTRAHTKVEENLLWSTVNDSNEGVQAADAVVGGFRDDPQVKLRGERTRPGGHSRGPQVRVDGG